MASPYWSAVLLLSFLLISASLGEEEDAVKARRQLMSFKETPIGTNITYDCSPSGPCLPCSYSEKNDEKYRCSETGYRIPFKCEEIKTGSKEVKSNKGKKNRSALEDTDADVKPHVIKHDRQVLTSSVRQRNLLEDSSTSESGSPVYITYRSCVLSVNEEKLSVLGFEVIMLGLLIISGSTIYFRKRWATAGQGSGAVRLATNSRF